MKKLFKTIFLGIALLLSSAQQTNARTFRIEIVGDRTNVCVKILDEQDRPLATGEFDKNQYLIQDTIINMIAKVLIANTTRAPLQHEKLVNISNQIVQLCEQNLVQKHQFLSGAVILFAGALFTPTLFLTIPGACYLKYLRYDHSTHIFELNLEENLSGQFDQKLLQQRINLTDFCNFSQEAQEVFAQEIVWYFDESTDWRTIRALNDVGITTMGHLFLAFSLFHLKLEQISGIGPRGMEKIRDVFRRLNLFTNYSER